MNVRIFEVVNGEFYVTFTYPRQEGDEERYAALVEGNDISFPPDIERGQAFKIRKVDERRQGRKIYKVVEAHHVAFTLGNYFLDSYIDFAAAKTLQEMLTILGADTPFTFVVEGNFPAQDIFEWGEDTKFKLLQQLRELYGAELSFDNYTITLTTRKGGNYGSRVRYRHNLKGITRKSHDIERITRLYGYGKNGLTIEGYAGHTVKYIDSPYFDPNNPYMGKMEWPDIEEQGRLLQEMQKYLKKYELPKVSYDVDFVQMEKVDPEFEAERIREAGDTVTCFDEVLGYSFDARAMEYERYPFEPQRGRVVLANFREMKTSDYIFQATVGSKKALSYTNKNAVLKGVKYDDSITLVDGLGMLVSDDQGRPMVRLGQTGPGEYGQAMFNKAGVKTIWQDASTGDARFAGRLEAASGTFTGTLQAGNVIGSVITGGSIYGAYIATSGTYPMAAMSNTDNWFIAAKDANRFVLMTPMGDNPSIQIYDGLLGRNLLLYNQGGDSHIGSTNSLRITATLGDLYLHATSGLVRFQSWSKIYSDGNSQTLQQALDSLSSRITALGG
jgi:phage minor structural protein